MGPQLLGVPLGPALVCLFGKSHPPSLPADRDAGPLIAEQNDLVEEFARMVEEFRVSLFAQEVGTTFSISPKRLDKKWDELRGSIEIRASR